MPAGTMPYSSASMSVRPTCTHAKGISRKSCQLMSCYNSANLSLTIVTIQDTTFSRPAVSRALIRASNHDKKAGSLTVPNSAAVWSELS